MSEDFFKAITPLIIALLIIWLIYRIRNWIKLIVKNEIYDNFPTIKDTIADLKHRIGHLKAEIGLLEIKIKELADKTPKE